MRSMIFENKTAADTRKLGATMSVLASDFAAVPDYAGRAERYKLHRCASLESSL